jgi:hypothetical protein
LDSARAAGAGARLDEKAVLGDVVSFIAELWEFIRSRKKFWLMPIVVLMLIFGGLIVLTKGSAIAPFIYTLF